MVTQHDGYGDAFTDADPCGAGCSDNERAPKFGIQDREIDGDDAAPESVTRNVDEGTKAVADFERHGR